jgi:hypothetical protein
MNLFMEKLAWHLAAEPSVLISLITASAWASAASTGEDGAAVARSGDAKRHAITIGIRRHRGFNERIMLSSP